MLDALLTKHLKLLDLILRRKLRLDMIKMRDISRTRDHNKLKVRVIY